MVPPHLFMHTPPIGACMLMRMRVRCQERKFAHMQVMSALLLCAVMGLIPGLKAACVLLHSSHRKLPGAIDGKMFRVNVAAVIYDRVHR